MDTVGIEKGKIENEQRALRRQEQSEGREWQRRFFKRVQGCPKFEMLAKPLGERLESDKTGGVWRFDEEKARGFNGPLPQGHAARPPTIV